MLSKIKSHYREGSFFKIAKNVIRKPFKKFYATYSIFERDLKNKIKYGPKAPKYCERIWIDPNKIDEIVFSNEIKKVAGSVKYAASGIVVDWSKIEKTEPLKNQFRIQYCYEHWMEGKSWEEIGIIDYMSNSNKYGHWSKKKIRNRFDKLDTVFDESKKVGRLKTRKEIDSNSFREKEGILVHIGSNGKPYFGGGGFHRLAIAQILKFEKIPVCVGVVDKNSLEEFDRYRKP